MTNSKTPYLTVMIVSLSVAGLGAGTGEAQVVANPDFEQDGGWFTVAAGWSGFGGDKWEGSAQVDHGWVQGMSDIGAGAYCGVQQLVSVSAGTRYRLAAEAKTTTTGGEFNVQVGIDPSGNGNPTVAVWGAPSYSTDWSSVSVEAVANGNTISIFLRVNNTDTLQRPWWGLFDSVTLTAVGTVDTPTPTSTNLVAPTATPTNTPGVATGPPAWKLTYMRQIGYYMNHNPLGEHVLEVHCSRENGAPGSAVGLTNRANSGFAIFGNTDAYGHNRIPLNPPNNPYDVHVYNPPTASEESPDLHWYNGAYGYSGHYSFECHFRYYAHDDSTFHPDPLHPVYHYDRTDGLNSPTLDEPEGWESDAGSLTEWAEHQTQTFVVPAGINRIISAKAMVTRGFYNGAPNKVTYHAAILQGGPTGPQVGPTVTSREISADEFFPVTVHWGSDDVPVFPGQTYALKTWATDGGGFNVWAVEQDNYPNGMLYNGGSAVAGRDMIAVVIGAYRAKADGATSTPTNTPVAPSVTPTRTPTTPAGGDSDGDGVPDAAERWQPTDDSRSSMWLPDSDGDGLDDGLEDANRNGLHDPGETFARYQDSDCDGLEDGLELLMGTDPLAYTSGYADDDGDGLPNVFDPDGTTPDADEDRYKDGYEAVQLGLPAASNAALHPTLGDTNGDGATSNLDALITQSLFLGTVAPGAQGVRPADADLNRDGYISNVDSLVSQSYFLNTIALLPLREGRCGPSPTSTPTGATPTPTRTPTRTPTATFTPTQTQAVTSTPTSTYAGEQPDYWDPRLDQLMIEWIAPNVAPGTVIWKLVRAVYEDELQSGGTHSIFYRCLDFDGTQLGNVRVVMEWPGGSSSALTKTPPDWGDIAMAGGNWCPFAPPQGPYTGYVGDGLPSYQVKGMGMPCNRHVNYKLTFQKIYAPGPPPTATPTNTPGGPTATPTPTEDPSAFFYRNDFEEFLNGQLGGKVVWLPVGSPGFIPLHDGGAWEPLDWQRGAVRRNGTYSCQMRVLGNQASIRGLAILGWWENDIKLPANTTFTLSVWVKNDGRPGTADYVDVLLCHASRVSGESFSLWDWDEFDRRFGAAATNDWTKLEITFTTGSDSNRRDQIWVAFGANPAPDRGDINLYVDEMRMVRH